MASEVTGSEEGMPHPYPIWRLLLVKNFVAPVNNAQPCSAFHR